MKINLRGFTALVWLAMMTACAALYMTLPPSPDQSQFDWMAFISTRGYPFYVGSFDMNWPGEMWLHELGIRLFGIHAWTWRLTDFILMAGFTISGATFLSRSGWRLAPFVFLFLYPPIYITAGGWMVGQRDIIATGFLLVACALSVSGGKREIFSVLAAGLMVSVAVLIRPTFMSFIAGLIILELFPFKAREVFSVGRTRRSIGFLFGFTIGLGAAALFGLYLGNLDDWYQQSIEFSLSVYAGEPAQDWRVTLHALFVQSWHWISCLALIGIGFWVRRDGLSYALMLTLGVVATSAVSFVVQNKGFGYHLGGILTMLVLYVAVMFDGLVLWRRSSNSQVWSAAVFAAAMLLVLAGTASKIRNFQPQILLLLSGNFGLSADYGLTEAERVEIIAIIQRGNRTEGKVSVYGTNFELAYRAERLPSHRFINVVIDQANPKFPLYEKWMKEIKLSLDQQPPQYIIFNRAYLIGPINRPTALSPDRPVLRLLIGLLGENYRPVFNNDHVVVYARNELPN